MFTAHVYTPLCFLRLPSSSSLVVDPNLPEVQPVAEDTD